MEKVQDIQFFHGEGHKSVVKPWEALFDQARMGLQAAICYATAPGLAILQKAAHKIAYADGFFVASVEYPTDIDAMHSLHRKIPGRVYIHLGYETPRTSDEARQDGYALMHSKLMLAHAYLGCHLWVGSHNLTARAMSGANLEAGVLIQADHDTQVIKDAQQHLLACRDSAEEFDPARIEIYKRIQKRKMGSPIDVEPLTVLVIHAEAHESIRQRTVSSVVHLCLKPHQLDKYFAMDREVRLFIHPYGNLAPGKPVDMSKALGWKGRQTAIARTESHPHNHGIQGIFATADFQVFIEDLSTPPMALPPGAKLDGMTTQVVMRFDHTISPGSETYSVRQGTEGVRMVTEAVCSIEPIDPRLESSFRPGSLTDGRMNFGSIVDIGSEIKVQAYMDTLQPLQLLGESEVSFSYTPVIPKNLIDPYFFITKNVVRISR